MQKAIKLVLILIILVIITGIGLLVKRGAKEPETLAEVKRSLKIGVLADLSGDYADFLKGGPRGAEMAVADLRSQLDREIELIIEDQKSCDAKETVTIMNKFVGVDKVDVIIGGTCSNTTLAAAPVANQAKTIMISGISSAPSISQAGEYIFRTYISDLLRAQEAGNLAYGLGYRKMAVLIETGNDYSIELAQGAKEAFMAKGGEIVAEEKIGNKDTDFRTQLTKIKAQAPDILLISISGPNQIGLVVKQARELGVDVQIMHPGETPENQEVLDVAGETADGLIYIMPGNPPETSAYKALAQRYQEKYGEPHTAYFTEVYDAVMLGVKAVLASDGTKEDIKDKLYEVSKTYQGVSGNVAFDENGDVSKPILVKQIKNGEFVLYED